MPLTPSPILSSHQQTVVSPPSPPHPHIDAPDEVLMMMLFLSHHTMKMRSRLQPYLQRSIPTPQPKKVSECRTKWHGERYWVRVCTSGTQSTSLVHLFVLVLFSQTTLKLKASVTTVVSVLESRDGCFITVGTPKPRSLFPRDKSIADTDLQSKGTDTAGAVGGKWMSVHFQPGTLSPTSPTKRLSRIPSFIELVRRVVHMQHYSIVYCGTLDPTLYTSLKWGCLAKQGWSPMLTSEKRQFSMSLTKWYVPTWSCEPFISLTHRDLHMKCTLK